MTGEPHEEDPKVNMVLQNGMMIGKGKGKQPKEGKWVRKVPEKEIRFHLECTREMFMEVKKIFTEAFTSGSEDKPAEEIDPSMLTTFLETCMKLFHDSKAMKGL